jgi:hypothetical protein
MKNLKALAATLLLATTATVAAPKANAADMCMPIAGGQVCANYYRSYDHVVASLPGYGTENMEITCRNGRFYTDSRGDWSRSEVKEFAANYCSSRGAYAHN